MHFSRSRVAVIATAGTAALLSLPVVALGQVPNLNGVVGGATNQVPSLPAPVPALPALPPLPALPQVQAPAPTPAPAPSAPPSLPAPLPALPKPGSGAPAAPAPAAPAAPAAGGGSVPGGAVTVGGKSSAKSVAGESRRSTRRHDGGPKAISSSDKAGGTKAKAASEADAARAEAAVAADAADLPDNASPETVPFTGLQLALIAMAGLAALAAGAVMRHGTRIARR